MFNVSFLSDLLSFLTPLLFGYLLGSIPFGLILTGLSGFGDIRNIGSGNIGATNVLRTGNKKLAMTTLFLDTLKGTAAVLIARLWDFDLAIIAGLGAFLGHLYPVWINFKGGKGVATYLGILIGLVWQGAVTFAIVWLLIAFFTRYSSLSALMAAIAVPISLYYWSTATVALFFAALSMIIIIKHRSNISRLIHKTEGKIGAKE